MPSSHRTYSLSQGRQPVSVNASSKETLSRESSRCGNALLLLPFGEVRDKERQRRVDSALLEVRLKLGLDTLVEVVKLPPRTGEGSANDSGAAGEGE